ncbi:hypothetical protein BHM03_00030092 [Ensete ventricosum]|nr:hypothetical protein BHM03_00030092 [Ensete ventricosum]
MRHRLVLLLEDEESPLCLVPARGDIDFNSTDGTENLGLNQGWVRPHIRRYVPVHRLTSTRTACYRAVPSKSTIGGRLREKKGEEEEGVKYLVRVALPRFPCTVCLNRAAPSRVHL